LLQSLKETMAVLNCKQYICILLEQHHGVMVRLRVQTPVRSNQRLYNCYLLLL